MAKSGQKITPGISSVTSFDTVRLVLDAHRRHEMFLVHPSKAPAAQFSVRPVREGEAALISHFDASRFGRRFRGRAEALCRHYLSTGCREGNYRLVGDIANRPSTSMLVRLKGDARSRWTDYFAPRVTLRPRDWTVPQRQSTGSTQHSVSAPREVS